MSAPVNVHHPVRVESSPLPLASITPAAPTSIITEDDDDNDDFMDTSDSSRENLLLINAEQWKPITRNVRSFIVTVNTITFAVSPPDQSQAGDHHGWRRRDDNDRRLIGVDRHAAGNDVGAVGAHSANASPRRVDHGGGDHVRDDCQCAAQ